jgi:hypothetical protein
LAARRFGHAGRMLERILPLFCTHSPNRATSTAHELDSAQVTPACLHPPPRDTNCETRPPASTDSVDPQIKRFGLAAPPDPRSEHVHSPLLWSSSIFVRCPPARRPGGQAANIDGTVGKSLRSASSPPRTNAVPVGHGMCPRAAAAQFDVFTSWSDPPRLSFTSEQPSSPPSRIHPLIAPRSTRRHMRMNTIRNRSQKRPEL